MSVKDLIKNYQDHAKGINLQKKKISAGLEIKKQIYEDALHTKKTDTKKNVIDEPIKKAIKEKISDWKLLDDLTNNREPKQEPKQEAKQEPKQEVKQLVPKNVSEGIKEKQKKYAESIKKDNSNETKPVINIDMPEEKFNEKLSDWKTLDALTNGNQTEKKETSNDNNTEEIEEPIKKKKHKKHKKDKEGSSGDQEKDKKKKHKKKHKKDSDDETQESEKKEKKKKDKKDKKHKKDKKKNDEKSSD